MTTFEKIADALKKELEPQGFEVYAHTNTNQINILDKRKKDQWLVMVTVSPPRPIRNVN